ncbi:MAG: hypothetical protein IKC01_09310 [Clostridia bacterium]|nr:hypothetical protein [Clostridia bacterium]
MLVGIFVFQNRTVFGSRHLKDVLGKYPKNDLEYDALLNSIREEKFSVLNYNRCMLYAVLIFNRGISSFNGNYDLEYYNMDGISVEILKYKNSFFNIEKTKNIEGEYIAVNVHVVLEGEKGFYNITYFPNIESQDEMFICKLINSLEKTV